MKKINIIYVFIFLLGCEQNEIPIKQHSWIVIIILKEYSTLGGVSLNDSTKLIFAIKINEIYF